MTDKKPIWKGNVLYVWSDIYRSYIDNIDEWKKMMRLDKYKELKE